MSKIEELAKLLNEMDDLDPCSVCKYKNDKEVCDFCALGYTVEFKQEPPKVSFAEAFKAHIKYCTNMRSCVTQTKYECADALNHATDEEIEGMWTILD
jgi:hypothetical protein